METSKRALFISFSLHLLIILALIYGIKSDFLASGSANTISIQNAYLVLKAEASSKLVLNHSVALPQNPVIPAETGIQKQPSALLDSRLRGNDNISTPPPEQSETASPALSSAEIQQLLLVVAKNIQQHLQYPHLAATHTEQGQSLLQFELNAQGELQNIEVVQSSGVPSLDQAAIQAINMSSPIAIPSSIQLEEPLILRLPVSFKIQS